MQYCDASCNELLEFVLTLLITICPFLYTGLYKLFAIVEFVAAICEFIMFKFCTTEDYAWLKFVRLFGFVTYLWLICC